MNSVSLDVPHQKKGPSRVKSQAFSGLPFDVYLARNAVLNRLAIDVVGLETASIGLARNQFERLERFLDFAFRVTIGFALPVVSGMAIQRYYGRSLAKQFKNQFKQGAADPLAVPFKWLDKANFNNRIDLLSKQPQAVAQLQKTGLKSFKHLTPQLAQQILKGKIAVVAVDMALMAIKGITFFWVKNALTEKLSGKRGFSGTFKYTSDKYREQKSQDYNKNKHKRHMLAGIIGMTANLSLPLAILLALRSRTPAAKSFFNQNSKGLVSRFKAIIPAFEYTDVVYMSKWSMFVHAIFNWNLAGFITARDAHEKREHLVRTTMADLFFFFGDDLISGAVAKRFQNKYASQLKYVANGVRHPIQLVKKGLFGLPYAESYPKLYRAVESGHLKNASPKTKQLVHQLGRIQFLTGLAGTALGLGVSMTLLNNWYTKQKILREQSGQAQPIAKPEPKMIETDFVLNDEVIAELKKHYPVENLNYSAA